MNSPSNNVPLTCHFFSSIWVPRHSQTICHYLFLALLIAVITGSTVQPAAALEFDYDEMATALKGLQIEHSPDKSITTTRPCAEITDKNVGIIKGISKKTKQLENVSKVQKFDVAFCKPSIEASLKCAPESVCKTVYKWQKALTEIGGSGMYVEDEILVPTACMCFLGGLDGDADPAPVIIL
uniref:Secreted protein n=1 Tax=Panagrellus redivivus TaxID=6233 RepID=A0A7E4UYS9_PANRE